jgi:soluble lytic murein transglycosylase-like protein
MNRLRLKLAVGSATLMLAVGSAMTAQSQVLEIGDDGMVKTYAAPAIFSDSGVRSIETEATPRSVSVTTPAQISAAIQDAATRHAVPATVVEAVAWQESRFNQAAVSPKGARGVMQLMPGTAALLGVDASDLRGNIDGGVAYLSQQISRFGDLRLALAAYNAGPEAVARHGGVPPYAETQSYVRAIMARLALTAPQLLVGAGR